MKQLDWTIEDIPPEAIEKIDKFMAYVYRIMPIHFDKEDNCLTIAVEPPNCLYALDAIRFMLDCKVIDVVSDKEKISAAIEHHYGSSYLDDCETIKDLIEVVAQEGMVAATHIDNIGQRWLNHFILKLHGKGIIRLHEQGELARRMKIGDSYGKVSELCRYILSTADQESANRVIISPAEAGYTISLQKEDSLREIAPAPKAVGEHLIRYIKLMAGLDTKTIDKEQKTAAEMLAISFKVPCTVFILPTDKGEKAVLRLTSDNDTLQQMRDQEPTLEDFFGELRTEMQEALDEGNISQECWEDFDEASNARKLAYILLLSATGDRADQIAFKLDNDNYNVLYFVGDYQGEIAYAPIELWEEVLEHLHEMAGLERPSYTTEQTGIIRLPLGCRVTEYRLETKPVEYGYEATLTRVFAGVTTYLAVGANIEPEKNIPRALALLQEKVRVTGSSTFYRTAPLGRPEQEDFLNGVWRIETELSAPDLKDQVLRKIEAELGRERTDDACAPRPIDLDILLHGGEEIDAGGLRLPAPEIRERIFVAAPLLELAGDIRLPGGIESLAALVDAGEAGKLEAAEGITMVLQERITA